ncbi:hypothetical protein NDU88_005789 [Pleurodeles waltl]|uniref:Uncharacterized protein n=1 Tax=Pleurodeles waltl TaxID=8319 RepID=A0AAV7RMQ7_PLEWA|nr:hypothetical protein NDU88_005789 [Pleurodeles waltl]
MPMACPLPLTSERHRDSMLLPLHWRSLFPARSAPLFVVDSVAPSAPSPKIDVGHAVRLAQATLCFSVSIWPLSDPFRFSRTPLLRFSCFLVVWGRHHAFNKGFQ